MIATAAETATPTPPPPTCTTVTNATKVTDTMLTLHQQLERKYTR